MKRLIPFALLLLASAAEAQSFGGSPIANTQKPTANMLISSRLLALGQYNATNSNGTDTGSNSRLAVWNESGATVTGIKVIYPDWKMTSSNEADCPNAITITSALEYPAGVFTQVTFGGSASTTFFSGNKVSDNITVSWPSDAQAWIRTYVTVSSGNVWCRGILQETTQGEAVDSGTTTSDLTMSGTITNNAGVTGYGPVAITGTSWTGTPRKFAIAAFGDSLTQGSVVIDARGNNGPMGFAAGLDTTSGTGKKVPFLNLGTSGATIVQNQCNKMGHRIDAIQKAGVTLVAINYGTNDLINGLSAAQIEAQMLPLARCLNNLGYKVVAETVPPHSASTDNWITLVNQTPNNPGWSESPPVYSTYNTWLLTVPSPFYDVADPGSANDSNPASPVGKWAASGAGTNLTVDGTHWYPTTTSPEFGGFYLARDVFLTKIGTWCGC